MGRSTALVARHALSKGGLQRIVLAIYKSRDLGPFNSFSPHKAAYLLKNFLPNTLGMYSQSLVYFQGKWGPYIIILCFYSDLAAHMSEFESLAQQTSTSRSVYQLSTEINNEAYPLPSTDESRLKKTWTVNVTLRWVGNCMSINSLGEYRIIPRSKSDLPGRPKTPNN